MITVKIITTFLNLLMGMILLAGMQDQALQGYAPVIVFAAMAALLVTFVAIWRSPGRQDRPFGKVLRVFRGMTWAVHFVWVVFVFVAFILQKQPWILLCAFPSVLVFTILSQKPKPSPAAANDDSGHVQTVAKALLEQNLRAYYEMHQSEIDVMEKEFRRLMIEKYSMHESYVQEELFKAAALSGVSPATAWHQKGETVEAVADKFINALYFSRDANNPAIFAKHMDTGEDLPPDYDYSHWSHRLLGRSAGQKLTTFIGIILICCFFYGLIFSTFLPSKTWSYLSLGIALALAIVLSLQIFLRWKTGRLRTQPGKRRLRKLDMIWLPLFLVFMLWFVFSSGIGATLTDSFGAPHQAVYHYKKKAGKPCLLLKTDFIAFNKFCLDRAAFDALPREGSATFKGKKSWFGASLKVML